MSAHNRKAFKPRVEYVNRSGDPVDPKTGRPLAVSTRKNKEPVQYPHIPYPKSGLHPMSKSIKKFAGPNKKGKKILPVKKTGAIFGNLDPIPTDARIDPPPHHCFNCWQRGHTKPKCPRPVVDRYCHNCGRRGEDLHTCPRCSGPYAIFQQRNGKADPNDTEIDGARAATEEPDADEVLQQLIYQDEERRHKDADREAYRDDSPQRYRERSRDISPYRYRDRSRDRSRDSSPQRYRDRSREASPYRYRESYRSRRSKSPGAYAPEWGRSPDRSPEYRREYRRDSSPYRERSPPSRSNGRKSPVQDDFSKHTDLDDNPVQEMLALIKSISHLPSNTQDMIVRQVMEERQYKLKLRVEQGEAKPMYP